MKYKSKVNKALARMRGLTDERIKEIEEVHSKLIDVINYPEKIGKPILVVSLVKVLEFKLQELWGFPIDEKHHRYWFRISGCECPKMDNFDRVGTGLNVINKSCPYHGNISE